MATSVHVILQRSLQTNLVPLFRRLAPVRRPRIARWGTCEVVLPHNFIRVNAIFGVGSANGLANGLVTAYADKHPSYEFLNGPSGVGLSQ
jgi:hypothetical protein